MPACAELSEETAGRLEQQEGMPCEVEGGTTFLDEGAQGWKVSAAGCTPTAPDLPYDCELES